MSTLIQFRRGPAATWAAANPILAAGEPGIETDTGTTKIGNGVDPWSDLVALPDTAALSATIGAATVEPTTVTPSLNAALAAISPSSAALAVGTVARANTNPPPILTSLITGRSDQTVTGISNTTVTSVPSPSDPSRQAWRVVRTAAGTECRLTVDHSAAPITPPKPAQAVVAWVYLSDPAAFTYLSVEVINASGTWARTSQQSGSNTEGQPLRVGWNLIRFAAHASTAAYLTAVTSVRVRAIHPSGTPTIIVGPVALESRPKASIVTIADWGCKTFYDIAYPDLTAIGVPVTWALRVNRLGTGTYPNNHISLAEAQGLLTDGLSAVSIHSWDGDPTSGMTAEQIRVEMLTAQAGLHAKGLFSKGAAYRAAWVQNQAPNFAAASPYLAMGPTYTDSTVLTPWPPLNRYAVPRYGIHGKTTATIDSKFAEMQATGESALWYTHGITPTGDANHCSQAEWDYFLSKVAAGVSAGWLEGRTLTDLIERERLSMPIAPL